MKDQLWYNMDGQNTEEANYITCQRRMDVIITPISGRRVLHVLIPLCHVHANEKGPLCALIVCSAI